MKKALKIIGIILLVLIVLLVAAYIILTMLGIHIHLSVNAGFRFLPVLARSLFIR